MKRIAAIASALLALTIFTACAAPKPVPPANNPDAARAHAHQAQDELDQETNH